MITMLLKHEWLRTWRWAAVLTLGAALLVGTFTGASLLLPAPTDMVLAVLAVLAAMIFMFAVPLLTSLDFYRSCYSRTGYFTASLPVKAATIFRVKATYSYLVSLLGVLLGLLLLIPGNIATGATSGASPAETMAALGEALRALGSLPPWLLVLIVATLLLYPLSMIAPFYFAATVGSQSWINRAGFGGVVLTWFLYYSATQVIGVIALFIPPMADLSRFPEVSLIWGFGAIFTMGNDAAVLPLAVFVALFAVAIAGMCWAQVSYSRKLELR